MATAQVHHGGRLSHLYGAKRRDPAVKLQKVLQADNVLSKDGPFSKCRTRWSTTYSADYWNFLLRWSIHPTWTSHKQNETHFQLGCDRLKPVTYAASEFSRRPGRQPPPFDPGAGNSIPDMNPQFNRDKQLETSVYKTSFTGADAKEKDLSSEALFRENWNKYQRKTHFQFGDDCVQFQILPVKTNVATVDQMRQPLRLPSLTPASLPVSSIFRPKDREKNESLMSTYKNHYSRRDNGNLLYT
ncbi:uncharacterized protein LOC118430267 isoform X1 [Branchiostoma floridae]|uniref:Uncharacterized protein LOC118430267 isoform X1 n=1 Tax=Branchiostoma floridae TaxID=7739 RepID=C3XS30_BRAFL|nr:uncharacterized protein LOC118430267 isoform X1 [Branchiostoma floridae]|eukprot:XP_002613489.1 hypothetical protein BRAFLDRAFT_119841 [Branchiostoma floridae]